ncbi:MAG: molecular chaperone HtpG, partial [Anaerolineales bacterium]
VKEGMATDPAGQERLKPLLRFFSSRAGELKPTSLSEYVGRMQPEQREIYYVLGDDLQSVTHSPHLDYFRRANLEVLYLVDPLDSFMLSGLQSFEGFPLKNANDPNLELPKPADAPAAEALPPAEFEALSARFKEVLGDRISDVRVTDRLVDSPLRLVSPGDASTHNMDRVRRMMEKDFTVPQKIVEINAQHPLIKNVAALVGQEGSADLANTVIEQLYESALLVEGLLTNPAGMVGRIQKLMEAATKGPG